MGMKQLKIDHLTITLAILFCATKVKKRFVYKSSATVVD